MVRSADARRAVSDLARLRARQRNELLQRISGHGRMDHEKDRVARQERYGNELPERIVIHRQAGMWRNNDRRFGRYQKRLTVGLRLGDDARADASSRAGAIFDEES